MAVIRPFQAVRPVKERVAEVAALPYDVYNREEAKEVVKDKPYSFLRIDRAETQFGDEVDTYAPCVYEKASEIFEGMCRDGVYLTEDRPCYYVYELVMNGRSQTGITACASIDDYQNGIIKKHENTREEKEQDRIRHVDALSAQTGPIFLAYRASAVINQVVAETKKKEALYDFTSEDGIRHIAWKIDGDKEIALLMEAFSKIDDIYIADGHHRAASAVKAGLKRRSENPGYTGEEEFNFFLSVLFPDEELMIMDYNRTVADLNGFSEEEFLSKLTESFVVEKKGAAPYAPEKKGSFGMYLSGTWYALAIKEELVSKEDVVASLDVSVLQEFLLEPVLGIKDPRTDKRIDFIGGIRGLSELQKRADTDMKVSFSMYPTSISELFAVADAKRLMPPKSTWFEPKLRSGIFIHRI